MLARQTVKLHTANPLLGEGGFGGVGAGGLGSEATTFSRSPRSPGTPAGRMELIYLH